MSSKKRPAPVASSTAAKRGRPSSQSLSQKSIIVTSMIVSNDPRPVCSNPWLNDRCNPTSRRMYKIEHKQHSTALCAGCYAYMVDHKNPTFPITAAPTTSSGNAIAQQMQPSPANPTTTSQERQTNDKNLDVNQATKAQESTNIGVLQTGTSTIAASATDGEAMEATLLAPDDISQADPDTHASASVHTDYSAHNISVASSVVYIDERGPMNEGMREWCRRRIEPYRWDTGRIRKTVETLYDHIDTAVLDLLKVCDTQVNTELDLRFGVQPWAKQIQERLLPYYKMIFRAVYSSTESESEWMDRAISLYDQGHTIREILLALTGAIVMRTAFGNNPCIRQSEVPEQRKLLGSMFEELGESDIWHQIEQAIYATHIRSEAGRDQIGKHASSVARELHYCVESHLSYLVAKEQRPKPRIPFDVPQPIAQQAVELATAIPLAEELTEFRWAVGGEDFTRTWMRELSPTTRSSGQKVAFCLFPAVLRQPPGKDPVRVSQAIVVLQTSQ